MPTLPAIMKLQKLTQEIGILGLGSHLGRKLLSTVPGGAAKRLYLMELADPSPDPEASNAAKSHEFRFATEEDISFYMTQPESKLLARDLRSLREGAQCLLQLDGKHLVGYTWIHRGPMVELVWGIHFNMADDMVYNYNGFTLPKYRGAAFQALRHLKILRLMKNEGKSRLFSFVDHMNYKSLRGTGKSGYKKIGVIRCTRSSQKIHFTLTVQNQAWSNSVRLGPFQYDN